MATQPIVVPLKTARHIEGWVHTYHNFQTSILEEVEYVCANGHRIHDHFHTIHYEDICLM